MKKFDVPVYFRSPLISKLKTKRKLEDPMKKDFSPSELKIDNTTFLISRHLGFCYGVENAIEKSYLAIQNNPDKRIFLLSQMIHNPDVNKDLEDQGVRFIQDTYGNQLIDWDEITKEDIVIIPAFGTTLETSKILDSKGIEYEDYNTTCPFVEKVWNRSKKLGTTDFTVIIHGKAKHEETKATFSHSKENAASIVIRDLEEAKLLAKYISRSIDVSQFKIDFKGLFSEGFDPLKDLTRFGVVNQTTMLASETQEIADYLKNVVIKEHGEENYKDFFADTRDTLCYATNDNQSATLALFKEKADCAIVVGGYNSSNTSHLVELLEDKFKTYFIKNANEIDSLSSINSFDIHNSKLNRIDCDLSATNRIIITSGASCPDSVVEEVIDKITDLKKGN